MGRSFSSGTIGGSSDWSTPAAGESFPSGTKGGGSGRFTPSIGELSSAGAGGSDSGREKIREEGGSTSSLLWLRGRPSHAGAGGSERSSSVSGYAGCVVMLSSGSAVSLFTGGSLTSKASYVSPIIDT